MPATTTQLTACPLDCPDSCSLEVEVTNGRVSSIAASDANALTQGFICSKVRRLPNHLYGSDRLLHPARRRGDRGSGQFERIDWEQAFELLVERIESARRSCGGEAILPLSYGGSNGLLTQDTTDLRLFRRLGASRLARTVCAAPSSAAAAGLYGKMPGVALEDYEHARLIVIWGANPSVTGIHLVPIIRRAQERGAKLVVIDPRRTPLAKKADLHLAPRPGSDLAIALALIRELSLGGDADEGFLRDHCRGGEELRDRAQCWTLEAAAEASGTEASDLETLARLYASSSPAVIRCGWGVERNRNGGSAVAAILALPAVAGKFGVRGGGYTMSNTGAWRFHDVSQAAPTATRTINMNRVGRALLELDDPPIEVLFVYNCNPLMTLPAQGRVQAGLMRDDLFTVVFDQVWTDTARVADLVLPATSFLEQHDIARGYGAMLVHRVAPAIAPVGEARSNVEVFTELTRRLGLQQGDDVRETAELAAGILGEKAPQEGTVRRPASGARPVQMIDCHPQTPDGKIDLFPATLDHEAPGGLYGFAEDPVSEQYPLALISPATSRTISSTFGQLVEAPARLEIGPDDAAARGLGSPNGGSSETSAELVRVYNQLGEVVCGFKINRDLRPGVVLLPKGLWARSTLSGTTANCLAPDDLTDLGAGACFNDARVEVEAWTAE